MARTGCLGRLFWLPAALLGGGRSRPALPDRGLDPTERDALLDARRAADAITQRLHAAGRDVDPSALDQIGGSAAALGEAVDRMGLQLAETRAWLSRHDPERLNRELTALELTDGPGTAARMNTMKRLREQARQAAQIQAELPAMSAKLRATAAQLGGLEGRLRLDTLRDDAAAAARDAQAHREEAERSLAAWQATVAELRALS
ncbi:MAG: hypothetical protein ACI8S6_001853 [Myxococcota bacterium]|jgi:hypothetical protein